MVGAGASQSKGQDGSDLGAGGGGTEVAEKTRAFIHLKSRAIERNKQLISHLKISEPAPSPDPFATFLPAFCLQVAAELSLCSPLLAVIKAEV